MVDVGHGLVCDATKAHSLLRRVNHGCEPNCELKVHFSSGWPRLGLFSANEPIEPQSELTFDYNFQLFPGKCAQRCRCGAGKCRGYIVSAASYAAKKRLLPRQGDGSFSNPIVID